MSLFYPHCRRIFLLDTEFKVKDSFSFNTLRYYSITFWKEDRTASWITVSLYRMCLSLKLLWRFLYLRCSVIWSSGYRNGSLCFYPIWDFLNFLNHFNFFVPNIEISSHFKNCFFSLTSFWGSNYMYFWLLEYCPAGHEDTVFYIFPSSYLFLRLDNTIELSLNQLAFLLSFLIYFKSTHWIFILHIIFSILDFLFF